MADTLPIYQVYIYRIRRKAKPVVRPGLSLLLHLPLRQDNDNSLSQAGPRLESRLLDLIQLPPQCATSTSTFSGEAHHQIKANQIKSNRLEINSKRKFSSFAQLAVHESNCVFDFIACVCVREVLDISSSDISSYCKRCPTVFKQMLSLLRCSRNSVIVII